MDLLLKFETQEIVTALGEVNDGDEIVLPLSGKLSNGIAIEGQDTVLILKKDKKKRVKRINNAYIGMRAGIGCYFINQASLFFYTIPH